MSPVNTVYSMFTTSGSAVLNTATHYSIASTVVNCSPEQPG